MIRLENVTKRYRPSNGRGQGTLALADVTLRVAEREFVCLLGPSGCGKSTLLNLVAGFIRPTAGRVLFQGRQVAGPGPERGVVFQDPTLFPWLTVRENVAFGLAAAGLARQEQRRRAADCLRLVGLEGHDAAYPHALSGGMRQRAALARILALDPKALLMDEPFGALDANSRERLQDELVRIWQAHRRTVLFVTHNVEEAAYLADRVIVMGPPPGCAGAKPGSLRAARPVELARPRDRGASAMRAVVQELRSVLDALPCCVSRSPGESRDVDAT
jgi:NitT/TauT family transport system ATP-binding protein